MIKLQQIYFMKKNGKIFLGWCNLTYVWGHINLLNVMGNFIQQLGLLIWKTHSGDHESKQKTINNPRLKKICTICTTYKISFCTVFIGIDKIYIYTWYLTNVYWFKPFRFYTTETRSPYANALTITIFLRQNISEEDLWIIKNMG